MIIQNVSKMLTVLADSTKHYHSPKPGEQFYLDDSAIDVDCIANAIADGMLKVVKMGGKATPTVGVAVPARESKVEDFISKFAKREVEDDEDNAGVITAVKPQDASDFTPPSQTSDTKKTKKGRVEDVGQKLMRGKKNKKLVPMVKTADANKAVAQKTRVIKFQGDGGSVALDNGSIDGSLIVNESGIPGQARVVTINEANDEDLLKAGQMTNRILDEAAKGRKLSIYMSGDQSVREKFIENTTDVEFLQEVATIEWQGEVAKLVRAKLSALGAKDE